MTEAQERPTTFRAYYYSFDATGVEWIDRILEAVAKAGKAYHSTEEWNDTTDGELTYIDRIQHAADMAAGVQRGYQALVEWQPIHTAPKDESWVLVWWPAITERRPVIARFSGCWETDGRITSLKAEPMMWRPLPPVPSPREGEDR